MYEFKALLEKEYGQEFQTYEDLRQWSIQNLANFWEHVWHFTGIVASVPYVEVP